MDMTEIRRLEEQKVGTLRLSEAIRIGARMKPQCFGSLFRGHHSCAIGAAFDGAGWTGRHDRANFDRLFPGLSKDVVYGITRRNDRGMARENIADWLAAQGL